MTQAASHLAVGIQHPPMQKNNLTGFPGIVDHYKLHDLNVDLVKEVLFQLTCLMLCVAHFELSAISNNVK
ncbi:hypothetical protein TK45_00450 [Bowmanella sp. JS7-9]|nr:hypothetical protein TK45_00450 [Bowmanella sp. JS7-9]